MAKKEEITEELNNQLEVSESASPLFINKEVSNNLVSIKSKVPYLTYIKYGKDTIMLQPYSTIKNLNKSKLDRTSNEFIILN